MGNVWDEYFYYNASRSFAQNIAKHDFQPDHWDNNSEHPPLGKYLYMPAVVWNKAHHVSDKDAYRAPRVISAIVGSLSVMGIFLIGAVIFSTPIGVVAALIQALMPPVIAYHKIIALDTLMVLFVNMSMFGYLYWLKNKNIRFLWGSVIAMALAIATKFNASLICLVFYGGLLISQWKSVRRDSSVRVPLPLLVFPILVPLILIAVWPWLWGNTLDHFLITLRHWGGTVDELFLGRFGPAPLSYFVVHFLVGTPLLVLILGLCGIIRVVKTKDLLWSVVVLWFVAPFLISFYHLRQDHIRYILAAYPALALLASLGVWWLIDKLKRFTKQAQIVVLLIFTLYLIGRVASIHPYYLEYYNVLVGRTRGVDVHDLFNLGFYGEGIKEATDYVNKTATAGSRVHYEIIPDDAPYLDRPRLSRYDYEGADYLIFNQNALADPQKSRIISTQNYHEVYKVQADDGFFVWVYKHN